MTDDDTAHMRAALALARRGLGNTWPNPAVGCVIVRNNRVVGRAVTAPGGRPHAEPQTLAMAGDAARGTAAYVTLEPCCHHGRTPPCTDALIGAGIARVVIAARDPDPRVNGQGVAKLRAAGIAVEEGVLAGEAAEILAGFHQRTTTGRPLVTLKLASTLDGRIATHSGESRWITGEPARRAAHVLRGRHDAILVGVGTVIADDPDLTCRLPGFRPTRIVRVVADSHLRTPLTARLVATARETPTWMLIRHGTDATRRHAFADARYPADRDRRRRGRGGPASRPDRRSAPPGSPGCWWRAARRSRQPCCAPAWWTASPGFMLRRSWAATHGPRCRRSASTGSTRCPVSSGSARHQLGTTC